jgi:nucleotide-binding universal stress UspA family protein
MRTYLVVVDDSPESHKALRFAARQAIKSNGKVHILALVEKAEFVAFGGVQATMAADAEAKALEVVEKAAGEILAEMGALPEITVKNGDAVKVVREVMDNNPDIHLLVLASAAQGAPGPLVSHFTGNDCGTLSRPVIIIPGGLEMEMIDELS